MILSEITEALSRKLVSLNEAREYTQKYFEQQLGRLRFYQDLSLKKGKIKKKR